MEIRIKKHIRITRGKIRLNGTLCFEADGDSQTFLAEAYRWMGTDCRRFFKMDLLSKLGFLASEWLMEGFDREQPKEDTGILFFNRSSSLDTDRHFQQTVQRGEDYFPSPAGFVYTLPNIVTGEVAIRHKIHGETSVYILPRPDFRRMGEVIGDTLPAAGLNQALAGWLEACGDTLDACVMLCGNGSSGEGCPMNERNMEKIWNY
ncbi:MAG: hypothetical protein LBT76_05850 [Tannerella sp.]|jgi:hypothetical protein|nr:hypothetical protein [Tannerella sp.]